jgi:hypothetical protein
VSLQLGEGLLDLLELEAYGEQNKSVSPALLTAERTAGVLWLNRQFMVNTRHSPC